MSKYKGLFTFDVDNHRYLPIEQADGLISDMNYNPEPEKEPKEYWYIDCYGDVQAMCGEDKTDIICRKQIGNYFETEEEAEKAVEKLKAWKRLKDKGFINEQVFSMNLNWCNPDDDDWQDYHLLFRGEE